MEILINIVLVIVGFVLLIKGADFLVSGASSLAKRFHVSDIAIGLTIVAMGTSAPELVVNIISGTEGYDGAVFGNIIGSNIFNMFLILGIAAVIYPISVQKSSLWKEIPYSLLATLVFFVLVNDVLFFGAKENILSIVDSVILLVMFSMFLLYIFFNLKKGGNSEGEEDIVVFTSVKTTLMVIGGLAGLTFGGKLIVDNAVAMARFFEVSERLIGLTILAAGTSLPELATTVVAALHKKSDLAIGNIIGSNVFNLLLVLGTSGLVSSGYSPLTFDTVLNTDLYVIMGGTMMLFVFMYTFGKYKLDRAEGFLYLLCFISYTYYLFIRL
ncbi:MAG: calcium/sodium antiporter [Imperialibacter sp.]|uniref:calcium/sodium antiporter n=1 Tax=Imperialibacter sp. TaxID=2038411 RepID=UPI0030D9B793